MTHFPLRLLCLALALALAGPATAQDDSLRTELERVYTDWRAALMAQSLQAWQRSTSTYRQMVTRNVVVSQGRPYPAALFDLPIKPPAVLGLRLLEVEAVGETAHLIYFGKIDLGVDSEQTNIPDNLMVLKFYKEAAGWKFDTTKYINLGSDDTSRDQLRRGNAEMLKHPPFNPPGRAPTPPKPCRKPENVAALRIHAIGYEVIAHINDQAHDPVADDANQQLLLGGLSMGDNPLRLQVREIPLSPEPGAERHLEVQVVVGTDNPAKPNIRVFRWQPTHHPAPAEVKLNVVLDLRTMKGV